MKNQDKYTTSDDDNLKLIEETLVKYNSAKDFTTLDAWKKARKVRLFFYNKVLPLLPKEEKYDLGSQIRRASVSCTNNIAEGYGRFHFQESMQFYRTSRGSLYEFKDDIITCLDQNYINKELFVKGIILIEDAKITLNGYINYTENQKKKYAK